MFLHDHPIVESNILSSWAQLPPSSQTLADLSSCFQILLNCYTGTQQTCVKKNRLSSQRVQNGSRFGKTWKGDEVSDDPLFAKVDPLCFWNKYLSIKNLWSAQKSRLAILPEPNPATLPEPTLDMQVGWSWCNLSNHSSASQESEHNLVCSSYLVNYVAIALTYWFSPTHRQWMLFETSMTMTHVSIQRRSEDL